MDVAFPGRTIQSQAAGIGDSNRLGARDVSLCGKLRPIFQADSSSRNAVEP